MPPTDPAPVVVVGGGAAGLLAARFAALAVASHSPAGRVILLESTRDGGRKILVSGGGRCNVLPGAESVDEGVSRFVTDSSPNTLRKILRSWPLGEQRRFFEEDAGVPLRLEPESGKLFPASDRARDVRDALLRRAQSDGVEIRLGCATTGLEAPIGPGKPWIVQLASGEPLHAARVILATGGLSMPGTGSDGFGLAAARRLGHTVHATYPALVPLTCDPPRHTGLAGVSLDVTLTARRPVPGHSTGAGSLARSTHGGFLFTHRGYSGPAVLDLSHTVTRPRHAGEEPGHLFVDWTSRGPEAWARELGAGSAATVRGVVRQGRLPERLLDALLDEAGIAPGQTLAYLRREERLALVSRLAAYRLPVTGDEGYAKAEVTGGGVALAEVNPRTLESRMHPGLYLCGEMLDAFGPIGGWNFAWAWATGRLAGLGAAGAAR